MRRPVDPDKYRIVLFDQRGCGRSTSRVSDPSVDLSTNTAHHLIADMELLREHLAVKRWLIAGWSWGTTLTLAYAERHPERVSALALTALTTTGPREVEWITRDVGRLFPASIAWICAAIAVAYAAGAAVSWVVQRLGRRSTLITDITALTRMPLRALLMVIAAGIAVRRVVDRSVSWRGWLDHAVVIADIAATTWVVASLVKVAERQAILRFAGGDTGLTDADRHRRRVATQVTVLRRLTIAIIVALGLAAALMTFPSFTDFGKTLFASAGVLSVVAGLAAQTSLGAVFAGIQIAFSDAIRVGDVVVLEDEWGRIEEITLTYVVVHLWDERRLVLPSSYFTKTPFQNWTRNATELLGTTKFDLDFSVPIDAMRTELERLLSDDELWDGRVGIVQVTDAVGGFLRVRMLVSASNAPALFDLRCRVREGITSWLQRTNPGALPRWRVEQFSPSVPEVQARDVPARRDLADASLFSGSNEAEQRGHAFEGERAMAGRPR